MAQNIAETEQNPMKSPSSKKALPTGKIVGAVSNAVTILRHMSRSNLPTGATRIAKETGINPSTCFNILRTLVDEDLVHFDPVNKSYTLSLGMMDIAMGATVMGNDIGVVRPLMDVIARARKVTLSLWQPAGVERMVLILNSLGANSIRVQMATGQRLPILIGSTGRCFAAFSDMSRDDIKRRFDRIKWQTPIDFDTYLAQVDEARDQGWALDMGNFAAGVVSIGVPVLDHSGIAVMGITATMLTGQFDETEVSGIVDDMQGLAAQVRRIVAGPG